MQDQGEAPEPDFIAHLKANFEEAFDTLLESLIQNNRVYATVAVNRQRLFERRAELNEGLDRQQNGNVEEEWEMKMYRALELIFIAAGLEGNDEHERAATQRLRELINGPNYIFQTLHTFQAELQILNLQKDKIDLEEQLKFMQIDEHLRILLRLGHIGGNF